MTTYLSHTDPRLGQINNERILRESPRTPRLLRRQISPVHRKMDLHNQRHGIQTALMPREQRKRLLLLLRVRQHCSAQQLHRQIIAVLLRQGLGFSYRW